jgi:hypothetical protein
MTAENAKELARLIRDVSVSLGNYRFAHWSALDNKERTSISDMEWSLLNYSSDLITQAVGLSLDETETSLTNIKKATADAKSALDNIKVAKNVIAISTSVIGLCAAIITKNPVAIASAVVKVTDCVVQAV